MYLINQTQPDRNENATMPENFERLRQWFENEMEPIKTLELHSKNKRVGEFT